VSSSVDTPLVSVVVIFLNAAPYLEEAVASVLTQSYQRYEIILIDDGSTDGSSELALELVARHPDRIRYVEHEGHANRGMSASRNVGVAHARGEYVAFLDADDVWLPEKLTQQVAALESHLDAGMTFGPGVNWYGWTGSPEDAARDSRQDLRLAPGTILPPPEFLRHFVEDEAVVPNLSGALVRRNALARSGGFEESFTDLHEDQAFFAKFGLGETVLVTGEGWFKYRQHEDSSCRVGVATGTYADARTRFLAWLDALLDRTPNADAQVRRAVARQLAPVRHPRRHRNRLRARRVRNDLRRALQFLTYSRRRA
jgi:glycosyltransferase involved in cell wall biosynthesis